MLFSLTDAMKNNDAHVSSLKSSVFNDQFVKNPEQLREAKVNSYHDN